MIITVPDGQGLDFSSVGVSCCNFLDALSTRAVEVARGGELGVSVAVGDLKVDLRFAVRGDVAAFDVFHGVSWFWEFAGLLGEEIRARDVGGFLGWLEVRG